MGTPAEAECAAALADMETSLAAIKFKEKTEEMRDKGKNAVNAFKRAREIEGQRKFYAEAKAVCLIKLMRLIFDVLFLTGFPPLKTDFPCI